MTTILEDIAKIEALCEQDVMENIAEINQRLRDLNTRLEKERGEDQDE